jgi:hypothetical protein
MDHTPQAAILIAGVPDTYARLGIILLGHKLRFVNRLSDAIAVLAASCPRLVMIGVHFDESNMFELLRHLKETAEYSHVPVICFRARKGPKRKLAMQSVETACRVAGAIGFIDLFDFDNESEANAALRALVDRTITPSGTARQ